MRDPGFSDEDVDPDDLVVLKYTAGTVLGHYSGLPADADAPPMCTWDTSDEAGKVRLHGTLYGPTITLWDVLPLEIGITDLAVHYTERESESRPGEIVAGPYLTLVGPAGNYGTGSEWAYRSLQQLGRLIGPPPWQPPALILARKLRGRSKQDWLSLTYLGRAKPCQAPG